MASDRENKKFTQSVLPQNLLDEAVSWISQALNPDDVFDDEALGEWASNNGYSKTTEVKG